MIAGGSYADAFGTAKLTANTWSFLTETYDGSTLRLYVNGTQVASTAHTGTIATSTNPLQIGGDSIYGQYFAGLIDNVRVYNVALTAAQIQTDQATAITSTPDTTPPSQPGTLTATAVSGSEVDLSWGASTDNVGVTGYLIERCSGASCTSFTQIAAPAGTGTSYKDTSVSAVHQLQLPRARHRRRRQPQPLLQHRQRHHPPTAAVAAGDADRDRGLGQRGRPVLGRLHRQRRHRLPDRALLGRQLHQLHPDRRHRRHRHHATRTPASAPPPATATGSAPPTPPATSAPTPTPPAPPPPPDTTPPTQPGTLTATAVSGSEVDLSWGASTDNVGVTGYLIERCSGASCSNFAQIAATAGTGTTYKDTSVSADHQLQLPGPRHRRRRQPQPLLQHRQRHHPRRRRPVWSRRMGLMRGRGRRSPTRRATGTTARSRTRPGRRPASTATRCSSTARTRWSRSRTRPRCTCRPG